MLIIAGGLGMAPLRPAVVGMLADRARYGRVSVLYGAATPTTSFTADELENWRQRLDVEVEVTVDRAARTGAAMSAWSRPVSPRRHRSGQDHRPGLRARR